MGRYVAFKDLVTCFGPQAPLTSGGVVYRLDLFFTGGDVDDEAIVDGHVFISVDGGEILSLIMFRWGSELLLAS